MEKNVEKNGVKLPNFVEDFTNAKSNGIDLTKEFAGRRVACFLTETETSLPKNCVLRIKSVASDGKIVCSKVDNPLTPYYYAPEQLEYVIGKLK